MSGSGDWLGFAGLRAMAEDEEEAVRAVLARRTLYRGAGVAEPREADACEGELARLTGRRHALLLNSGTSALDAALRAVGVGPGDEVLLPAYGWLTNVSAVLHLGAVPVLCPVREDMSLDPARLPECVSERTRAIVPVHPCGRPCDLQGVLAFARPRGLRVIDDACQSLGATIGGAPVGVGSDATVTSFQVFKVVTSGEGGGLMTDDDALYEAAVRYHDAGLARFARTVAPASTAPRGVGLNLRMSELAASLLRVQLGRLSDLRRRLHETRVRLLDAFGPAVAAGLVRPLDLDPGREDNGAFLLLRAERPEVARALYQRARVAGVLLELGTEDRLHTAPGWLEYLRADGLPHRVVDEEEIAEALRRVLYLQVNWAISAEALQRLAGVVEEVAGPSGA